nr:hypothetical protein [Gemmata massiliana]
MRAGRGGSARSVAYNFPISSSCRAARPSPASVAATNLRRTCFTLPSRYKPSYWASVSAWK